MAQRDSQRMRQMRMLARRYGLAAKGGIAVACALLVALLAAVGLLLATRPAGMVIEHATPKEDADAVQQQDSRQGASDIVQDTANNTQPPSADEHSQRHDVVVHVDGAVASPGVYVLSKDDPRVNDAVELAGGLTANADTSSLNLAAALVDGQKVHVPVAGEVPSAPTENAMSSAPAGQGLGSPRQDGGLVNINDATAKELMTLPGVGEATASAIIEDRERNGPFTSAEDLMRVSGIGEKKLEKVRDLICV